MEKWHKQLGSGACAGTCHDCGSSVCNLKQSEVLKSTLVNGWNLGADYHSPSSSSEFHLHIYITVSAAEDNCPHGLLQSLHKAIGQESVWLGWHGFTLQVKVLTLG